MPKRPRPSTVLTLAVSLCLCPLAVGCAGEGGGGGFTAAGLSREECEQLMSKISEVMSRGLHDEDREAFLADFGNDEDSIASCVRGETWDRAGYECAMKATSEAGLKRCILM